MIGLTLVAGFLAGCTRMRFVIDAIPADDELTETVVLEDDAATGWGRKDAKVALIDVTGLIADARRPGLLSRGSNPVNEFAEALKKAGDDHDVRAVIVRINSPGGTVTASDVMYRELVRFREKTEKPAVVLMADVAASGGYYLACAGDEIIAHPTTVTGSIGVIIQTFNFSEGMRRIGIRADAITSGPNKALGSPFEPMPEEHRAILQGIVNEFFDNFREVVTMNRRTLSPGDLEQVTDGRVVTGARAAEVGLVDRLGDLHDAFDRAKVLAELDRAQLVKYHRNYTYVGSPYAAAPLGRGAAGGDTQINLLQLNLDGATPGSQIGFYYLWDPVAFELE